MTKGKRFRWQDHRDTMAAMAERGCSFAQIAAAFGATEKAAADACFRMGISAPRRSKSLDRVALAAFVARVEAGEIAVIEDARRVLGEEPGTPFGHSLRAPR
jgi:hypothetical protein